MPLDDVDRGVVNRFRTFAAIKFHSVWSILNRARPEGGQMPKSDRSDHWPVYKNCLFCSAPSPSTSPWPRSSSRSSTSSTTPWLWRTWASNYIRKKGVGSSYAFGNTLPRDIALGRFFCGCISRRFSSVPLGVFTLDRLSLPEKSILKREGCPVKLLENHESWNLKLP